MQRQSICSERELPHIFTPGTRKRDQNLGRRSYFTNWLYQWIIDSIGYKSRRSGSPVLLSCVIARIATRASRLAPFKPRSGSFVYPGGPYYIIIGGIASDGICDLKSLKQAVIKPRAGNAYSCYNWRNRDDGKEETQSTNAIHNYVYVYDKLANQNVWY